MSRTGSDICPMRLSPKRICVTPGWQPDPLSDHAKSQIFQRMNFQAWPGGTLKVLSQMVSSGIFSESHIFLPLSLPSHHLKRDLEKWTPTNSPLLQRSNWWDKSSPQVSGGWRSVVVRSTSQIKWWKVRLWTPAGWILSAQDDSEVTPHCGALEMQVTVQPQDIWKDVMCLFSCKYQKKRKIQEYSQ